MANDPILDAIRGGGSGAAVADDEGQDPILAAIQGGGASAAKLKAASAPRIINLDLDRTPQVKPNAILAVPPFEPPAPPTIGEMVGQAIPDQAVPALAAAKKYAVDPFEKLAAGGAEAGGAIARLPLEVEAQRRMLERGELTGPVEPVRLAPGADQHLAEKEFPKTAGVATAVGETVGGMAADPRMWALSLGSVGSATLQKLMSAGFSLQAIHGAAQNVPQIEDAIKRGDTFNATRLIASTGIQAGIGALAGAHAMSETPTVGAGEQLHPEKPETLQGQVDALENGTNKAVYIPQGQPQEDIPEPPGNAQVTVVKGNKSGAGTWYHSDEITPEQIHAAVKDGSYGKLLGFTQPKEEAAAKGQPTTVVARDENGTELKAGLVDATNPQAIAEQAAEFGRQFPEGKISVETPEQVIAARQGSPTEAGFPNASAESGASLEAIKRARRERAAGISRVKIDTRSGQETLLIGPEAPDAKAGPYDRIVVRHPDGTETIQDEGAKARPLQPQTQEAARPAREEESAVGVYDLGEIGPLHQTLQDHVTAIEGKVAAGQPVTVDELDALNKATDAVEAHNNILQSIRGTAAPSAKNLNFRQKPQPLEERYSAQTLDEARQELIAAHQLASSFEQPGRYFASIGQTDEPIPIRSQDASKGIHAGGTWYGVGSSRHIVAEQFPWYGEIEQGPVRLGKIIEKGKGGEYNRLLGKVAESIQREKDSSAPVMAEYSPRLRELSERIDGNDQELSNSLALLADSDGRGFRNLREYIQGKVQDAERADAFFNAIDDAAEEAREASAAETPANDRGPGARESGRAAEAATSGEAPEASESSFQLTNKSTRSPRPTEETAALPGFESTLEQEKASVAGVRGERLTEEANRPLGSVEQAAGEMERESPLFRGTGPQRELYSGLHPKALTEGARLLQRAWEKNIAQPFIDKVLKLGDKYRKAREADPAVAEGLHLLDNAPTYLRAKAQQIVKDVVGNLSRAQERLFTLVADADSRKNLELNHPEEFYQAQSDPAIRAALKKYRPLEQELTQLREKMGGQTLEQDYLRRVYDKYVAGVGKAEAPGQTQRGTSAFDRVIRPQRTDKLSREATAEYHYENGLHEFGPAFGTKFIATHLKALRDSVAREFMGNATKLPVGASEPRSIDYNGQRYYRPDIARELRDAGVKNAKPYDVYDPTAGEKFPVPTDGKFLGPRELVKTLTDFGRREEGEPGALRRFFQEQILGFGFGIPHVANIMRRVSQTVPLGGLNPQGWARAWKVVLSKELRERGISGLNDPTFENLMKHGAISTGEVANLKAYWGGNLNPANWARSLAQIGHKFLFEPTAAKGFGGLDQRARLYIADLVKAQRPDLTDSQIASAVRTQLGDYNRANWTDQQKLVAKFMMFPGWDVSSIRWVLQHPVKTTVPPALMVLLANRTLNHFGQNRAEDRNDISSIHVGDRAYGTSLLRESVARNLFRPMLNFAQAKMQGQSNARAMDAASRGITQGAGGLLGMLRPDLSGFLALATNRQGLFSGKEIVGSKDYDTPGKILPSKALEKQAAFTLRHAVPALDRMLDPDRNIDVKSFIGGNMGTPNFKDDAEDRLNRNVAEANRAYQSISKMAKTDPKQAVEMLKDPDNAAYALFHNDLSGMTTALHKLDQVRATVEAAKIPNAEKQQRLKALDNARKTFLGYADGLNNLVFERKTQLREKAAPRNAAPFSGIPFEPPSSISAPQ